MNNRPFPFALYAVSLIPFVLLATANSAGYRYGASDLAFYGPAVMRQLDARLFPRDAPVIDAQARLTLMDETVATIARVTTDRLPALFLSLYVVTLVLLACAATAIGTQLYRGPWAVAALLAALTLRHAITKSGTNTLEGYFHPRQLAFACGALAVAAFLRGNLAAVAAGLAAAALLHPTTTLWFGVWLTVGLFVSDRRWRMPIALLMLLGAGLAWWAFAAGPLAGRLTRMDPEWLDALAEKEYLFPLRWPLTAWLANFAYLPAILYVFRQRAAAGLASSREAGLVAGCVTLVLVFLVAVVLNGARMALAIQLQPARIFWMLDFLATVYLIWAVADRPRQARAAAGAAALVIAASVVRGLYVMNVEFPTRPLFEYGLRGDWARIASWGRDTPVASGWLADPMHAAAYGTSLRMAAARDVFVEGTKDAAIGMYDRTIALRTRERLRTLGDFGSLAPLRLREIGEEFGLDYVVMEQERELPLAFQAGAIRVYRLR